MNLDFTEILKKTLYYAKLTIWMIVHHIILESFDGFKVLYKLYKESVDDEEIKGLIEEFKPEYLEYGNRILCSTTRIMIIFAISYALIFLGPENQYYNNFTILWPIVLVIVILTDKVSRKYKNIQEHILIFNGVFYGFLCLRRNLKSETYSIFELWICFACYCQFCSVCVSTAWKRIVFVFWTTMIIYSAFMIATYDNISSYFYISILYVCMIFPMTSMFVWLKYKRKVLLIKTNKELIYTIRTILQNFPEGVVIRSIDPVLNRTIMAYANDVAKDIINQNELSEDNLKDVKVNVIESMESHASNLCSLKDFLQKQEL